jgi:SNF2 family DNA or RNA helicase
VIDPQVITKWKARPLRDSATVKRFSRVALERELAKLSPAPDFVLRPHSHQLASFLLAVKYDSYALFHEQGLGKTKIVLDVFRYRKKLGQVQTGLVLVPSSSNTHEWALECARHAPDLTIGILDASIKGAEDREQLFWESDVDLVICTFRAFLLMVSQIRHGKLELWPSRLDRGPKRFQAVVADESIALSNPDATTTKALLRFSRKIPHCYPMTGTPLSNDPMGLFTQMKFCDGGETLGKNVAIYREAFFRRVQGAYAVSYKLARGAEPKLHRMLRHGSLRYEARECLDLPKCTGGLDAPLVRFVKMTPTMARHALAWDAQMQDAHIVQDTEEQLNIYVRMRKLSSGYIPTDEGAHHLKQNPKLDAFMQLLTEFDQQVICFLHYKDTADSVIRELRSKAISFAEITGRVANKGAQLEKFRAGARVLIGSRAAMVGLNLQFCNRAAFYESPDSVATRLQAQKRIDRMGQTLPTFIHDFVTVGTYDGRILAALKDRKSVFDAVVDGRRLEGESNAVFA